MERLSGLGKGTKLMAISDSAGLPISIHIASASPQEVTFAEATISAKCFITANEKPERLIGGDKAYDSDPLDEYHRIDSIDKGQEPRTAGHCTTTNTGGR